MKALVFSGGGAKGSYQIGVWKALRELGIKIDIVTGSSIGSINAAMFAQNQYYLAKKLWKEVTTEQLFNVDLSSFNPKEYLKVLDEILKNGGLSFDKAEGFLRKYIDEKAIRKSKIKYGLVTFSIKSKTPRMLPIEDIPSSKLVDYIIASSTCYPAIEKKEIDGDTFIDGGYYDNLPINLAIDMGATSIIAVDLNAIGFHKKIKDKTVNVDIINCSETTKFTLSFTKDYANKMMHLGYNDTMKYFKKLDGNKYTFKKDDLDKNYKRIKENYINILKSLLLNTKKNKIITEIFNISKYKQIFNNINDNKEIDYVINDSLEYLGEILFIDKNKIYNINKYNKLLLKEIKNLSYIKLDKALKGRMLVGYIYNKYMNCKNQDELAKEILNMSLIFQKEFLATVYLIAITKQYPIVFKSEEFYQEILKYLKQKK